VTIKPDNKHLLAFVTIYVAWIELGLKEALKHLQKVAFNIFVQNVNKKPPTIRGCPKKTSAVKGRGIFSKFAQGEEFFRCGRTNFLLQKLKIFQKL